LTPPPPAKPTLLQYYCATIAQYPPPPHRPLLGMPYTIPYWRWQYRVKAKMLRGGEGCGGESRRGQHRGRGRRVDEGLRYICIYICICKCKCMCVCVSGEPELRGDVLESPPRTTPSPHRTTTTLTQLISSFLFDWRIMRGCSRDTQEQNSEQRGWAPARRGGGGACPGQGKSYARRMGQPTQRATNYTARSNIEPAQILLHANGQSAPRSGGARDVGRGAGSHTPSTASESFSGTSP